jgi:hypothetical protein
MSTYAGIDDKTTQGAATTPTTEIFVLPLLEDETLGDEPCEPCGGTDPLPDPPY